MSSSTPNSARRPQGAGAPAGSRPRPQAQSGSRPAPRKPRAPAVEVRLRILDGPGAGNEYAIAGSVVRLGRGEENDIVLEDNNASRLHAEVVRDEATGRYIVRDLGSRNGIFVNRKKVPQAPLKNGDTFTIGGTSIEFVTGGGGGAQARGNDPSSGESGTLKRWLVVAAIVGGLVMVVVVIGGSGGGSEGGQTTGSGSSGNIAGPTSGGPGVTLGNLLQTTSTKSGVEVGRNTITKTGQLPVATATKPAAAGEVQSIMNDGDRAYSSQQLPDARAFYQRAVALDPSCEGCRNKLDKVDAEVKREIEASLTTGVSYYNTERFEEAKRAFERVKLLDPDPKSINNGGASNYINQINQKLAEQAR